MSGNLRRRKYVAALPRETTLRHVWLAGLGIASIARRRLEDAARRAADGIGPMRREDVRERLEVARAVVGPHLARVASEAEARLAPLLVRLGLARAPATRSPQKRAAGKGAPKKSAPKKSTRRPAARQAAVARMARRGR